MRKRGTVYFLQVSAGTKIGFTSGLLTNRLSSHSTLVDIRFVHAITCERADELEKYFHGMFKRIPMEGWSSSEVFEVSDDEMVVVRDLKTWHGLPVIHNTDLRKADRDSIVLAGTRIQRGSAYDSKIIKWTGGFFVVTKEEDAPPGSVRAVERGCRCPRMDNGYGIGYLGGVKDKDGNTVFVINENCPIHNQPTEED